MDLALPLGVTFVYAEPESAYALVERVAAPGAPGTLLHLHRATDEARSTSWKACSASRWATGLWRQAWGRSSLRPGIPLEHAFWNGGTSSVRLLSTVYPPGFERYFEELGEGLAAAGDDAEADTSLRKALSEEHDLEVLGPPRQAKG